MADTHVTITGNLTDDPDLKHTPNGNLVANFRLAVTARVKDGDSWSDGDTSFFRVNVWRQLAEHVTESLAKGDRAVVIGRLKSRQLGDPRGRQALGGRGRGRRGRPLAALGHRQARARHQRQKGKGGEFNDDAAVLSPGSSEAGADATRPGLAHHEPLRRSLGCTLTLPDPAASRAGPASAGRHLDRVCPTCGYQLTSARTQARCERRAARRLCPVCHQDGTP